jgi:hypothetical protein
MRTNLKVVLAAMGIAVLTSPVLAGGDAFARAQRDRDASRETGVHVSDCVHRAFPQCGASWRRARHIHKHHRE